MITRLVRIMLIVMGSVSYATEQLPREYAIGRNIALSLDDRKTHVLKQACMADEQLDPTIVQTLCDVVSSKIVHDDMTARARYHGKELSWTEFENELKNRGLKDFLLIGFGSLVNKYVSYQPNINIPGIVFGVKRIYNMRHPDAQSSKIGMPARGHDEEQLRLNTLLTQDKHDMANGLLLAFKVGTEEYAHLKNRERMYRLAPVKVALYRSLLERRVIFKDAYILSGGPDTRGHEQTVEGDPHIIYNSLTMDGFKSIQDQGYPGFLPFFLDTTYLSDGKTTIREWIKRKYQELDNE